jgi:hypothetical protein
MMTDYHYDRAVLIADDHAELNQLRRDRWHARRQVQSDRHWTAKLASDYAFYLSTHSRFIHLAMAIMQRLRRLRFYASEEEFQSAVSFARQEALLRRRWGTFLRNFFVNRKWCQRSATIQLGEMELAQTHAWCCDWESGSRWNFRFLRKTPRPNRRTPVQDYNTDSEDNDNGGTCLDDW